MPATASDFTRRGMAPALAVELAKQINSNTGRARRLIGYGMSAPTAKYVADAVNGARPVSVEKLTSIGFHPDMAKEIAAETNEPFNSVKPAITGTAQVGQVLTSTPGTWSGPGPFTYTRRWMANGATISGAAAATYTPVSGDIGKKISVEVRASNAFGAAFATSTETSAVIA